MKELELENRRLEAARTELIRLWPSFKTGNAQAKRDGAPVLPALRHMNRKTQARCP